MFIPCALGLLSHYLSTSLVVFLCFLYKFLVLFNTLRYPITVPLLHHRHTSAIITDCNRSTTLSPLLDLSGSRLGTETKQEVWLLRTGFGIAPVNKLVSLTWLFWALRSFQSFTFTLVRG